MKEKVTEQTKIIPIGPDENLDQDEDITVSSTEEDGCISDGRGGFWFCILDNAVMRDTGVSFCARGIYALLATYVDTKNRSWRLKIDTIASVASISRRQVQYALKELSARGYIAVTPVYEGGRRKASRYTLIGHDAPAAREQEFKKEEEGPEEQPDIERNICTYENIECNICTNRGAHIAQRLPEPILPKPKDIPPIAPREPEKKEAKEAGKKVKKTSVCTPEFEAFWKAYPNTRCSKQKAFRAWQDCVSGKKRASPAAPEELIRAAKIYALECCEQCREQRYILHASTFLGPDEHWRVYLQPKQSCGAGAAGMNMTYREVDIDRFRKENGEIDARAYERARRGLD